MATTFSRSDDLRGAEFADADLTGARFLRSDLSAVVMRGVEVRGLDLDAPWLFDGPNALLVNGVDVIAYVESELNRRFPGREQRRAGDVDGLRAAWAAVQRAWDATSARAAGLPDGTVEVSVQGEWSFAETLRHLVLATDAWLGRAIHRLDQPFHPLGLADPVALAEDGVDLSVFSTEVPTYAEVLQARADRVRMVSEFLDEVTAEQLVETRPNPWSPQYPETVLSCLRVILQEEWEHLRYAGRDLDAIEAAQSAAVSSSSLPSESATRAEPEGS